MTTRRLWCTRSSRRSQRIPSRARRSGGDLPTAACRLSPVIATTRTHVSLGGQARDYCVPRCCVREAPHRHPSRGARRPPDRRRGRARIHTRTAVMHCCHGWTHSGRPDRSRIGPRSNNNRAYVTSSARPVPHVPRSRPVSVYWWRPPRSGSGSPAGSVERCDALKTIRLRDGKSIPVCCFNAVIIVFDM